MKKFILPLSFGAPLLAVFLAVALSNQVQDRPIPMPADSQIGKTPAFAKARKVLEADCLNCHSTRTVYPWYSGIPGAKQLIDADVRHGRHHMDMEKRVFAPGKTPTVKTLKEIAEEVRENKMPPLAYQAVHWRSILSPEDKAAIQEWVDEELAAAGTATPPSGS